MISKIGKELMMHTRDHWIIHLAILNGLRRRKVISGCEVVGSWEIVVGGSQIEISNGTPKVVATWCMTVCVIRPLLPAVSVPTFTLPISHQPEKRSTITKYWYPESSKKSMHTSNGMLGILGSSGECRGTEGAFGFGRSIWISIFENFKNMWASKFGSFFVFLS